MSTMVGADVAELRGLANDFRAASRRIDSASRQLAPAIMRGSWKGPDADRFRHRWSSRLLPCLEDASTSLSEASEKLRQEADEQERASDSGGGIGPVTGPPWPHPLPDPNDPIPYPSGGWPGPWPPPFFPLPLPPYGWPVPWPDGPFGDGGPFGEGGPIQVDGKVKILPGFEVSLAKGDHWFTPRNTTNDPNSTTPKPKVTLASGEFSVGHEFASGAKHGQVLGFDAKGEASAQVGVSGKGSISAGAGELSASGQLVAGVTASAAGSIALANHIALKGSGNAYAGVLAQGSAKATKTGMHADGEVFAGAKAEGKAGLEVAGVTAGVKGGVWAGIGAEGSLDVGFSDGKLKIGASGGLALGVGGSIGVNVELDVGEFVDTAKDVADDIGDFFGKLF